MWSRYNKLCGAKQIMWSPKIHPTQRLETIKAKSRADIWTYFEKNSEHNVQFKKNCSAYGDFMLLCSPRKSLQRLAQLESEKGTSVASKYSSVYWTHVMPEYKVDQFRCRGITVITWRSSRSRGVAAWRPSLEARQELTRSRREQERLASSSTIIHTTDWHQATRGLIYKIS